MNAISLERWQEAQRYEAEYWQAEATNPAKLYRDIHEGHHFTRGVLDIRPATIAGNRTVLDVAGGPYPLGCYLGTTIYAVLDPGDYPEEPNVDRIRQCAEDYTGCAYAEVWGYNVLQHVRDPERVMAVAREKATHRVRWFDVVDTPVYPVHPHSIKADWLRAELSRDGFRIIRDIDGSRLVEGARQKWVALVAERHG